MNSPLISFGCVAQNAFVSHVTFSHQFNHLQVQFHGHVQSTEVGVVSLAHKLFVGAVSTFVQFVPQHSHFIISNSHVSQV
jgi:putative heme iron utilization protein